MKLKLTLKLFTLFLLLMGCKTEQNTQRNLNFDHLVLNGPKLDEELENIISNKKIVFITEKHFVVNPIIFLINNLDTIYNSGVRIIFNEGKLAEEPNLNTYNLTTYYPWVLATKKYEEIKLRQVLEEFNSKLSPGDRIKIIDPENGLEQPTKYDSETIKNFFLKRDKYAFNTIVNEINNLKKDSKAIVFYGGTHGYKESVSNLKPRSDITIEKIIPLGQLLDEYYGNNLITIGFESIQRHKSYFSNYQLENTKNVETLIYSKDLVNNTIYDYFDKYDAYIIQDKYIYGTYYQYHPNNINIKYMIEELKYISKHFDEIKLSDKTQRHLPFGKYLLNTYYLKMYFGNNFNYSFWSKDSDLDSALQNLEKNIFKDEILQSNKINVSKRSLENIEEYHELFINSGIEFLINKNSFHESQINLAINNLEKIRIIFPEDIWSNYWLGTFYLEKNDFSNAIIEFNKIITSENSNCFEALPKVYSKLITCSQEIGNFDKVTQYKKNLVELEEISYMTGLQYGDVD